MPRTVLTANGTRIYQLRLGLGMTQEELAEKAGLSKRQLERLEKGFRTSVKTLEHVAAVLGVAPIVLATPNYADALPEAEAHLCALHRRVYDLLYGQVMPPSTLPPSLINRIPLVDVVFRSISEKKDVKYQVPGTWTCAELAYHVVGDLYPSLLRNSLFLVSDMEGETIPFVMTVSEMASKHGAVFTIHHRPMGGYAPLTLPSAGRVRIRAKISCPKAALIIGDR